MISKFTLVVYKAKPTSVKYHIATDSTFYSNIKWIQCLMKTRFTLIKSGLLWYTINKLNHSYCSIFIYYYYQYNLLSQFVLFMAQSITFRVFSGSEIWQNYLRSSCGKLAQCKVCKNMLKCDGGSTKGLHVHLKSILLMLEMKAKFWDDMS